MRDWNEVGVRQRLHEVLLAERGSHTGAVVLTGSNRNDVSQLLPLLDVVPPVRDRVGRPRRKPDALFADRGYDHSIYRDQLRARRILPVIGLPTARPTAADWVPVAG